MHAGVMGPRHVVSGGSLCNGAVAGHLIARHRCVWSAEGLRPGQRHGRQPRRREAAVQSRGRRWTRETRRGKARRGEAGGAGQGGLVADVLDGRNDGHSRDGELLGWSWTVKRCRLEGERGGLYRSACRQGRRHGEERAVGVMRMRSGRGGDGERGGWRRW